MDDLSAWLDGELDDDRAAEIEKAMKTDPALGKASRELRRLNELLDAYAAPAPPGDLAERIIADARRAGRSGAVIKVLRWVVPAAAAAAVIIAVALSARWRQRPISPVGPSGATTPPVVRADGAEVIAKASFFADFYVLENFDTLEAIEKLEPQE